MRRLVAMVAAMALAASCGGAGGGGSDDVTFMVFGDPVEIEAYRDVIEAFRELEPGNRVRLVVASDRDDLLARLATAFSGGEPPDLFLVNYRFFGQFAAKDVLDPVGPRLATSSAFDEDDFYPQAIDAFRWRDELMCLPQNISSLVVYYNRDRFREHGVPEPEEGWTWDQMVERAMALTEDLDGDDVPEVYGLGVEPSIIRVAPFVWSNGGEIVDDLDRPSRLAMDSVEALEALQRFFDLRLVQGVVPSAEEVQAEDDESRFLNGRLSMLLSSRRSTPVFRTITEFDWDVAPLPVLREPVGILHSDAYCMTAASANKDRAWRFMEFALGPEGQRITAESGRTVPSLMEVASSDAFLDPDAKPASSGVFLDTIPFIRAVPVVSTWPEIEDLAGPILEEGLYQAHPVVEVVTELDVFSRDIFARAEY